METAVILAAGRGTRLGNLTTDLPKPMLPLKGRPLLEHILDRLRGAGFRRAVIVTGYKAELVESYFRAYPLDLSFARQAEPNGTARAVLAARDLTGDEPFLMAFGDILVEPDDYRGMGSRLVPGVEAVAGCKYVDDPWQGAAVYVDANDRITSIVEKPPRGASATHWNSAGLYSFRPAIFEELERVPVSPRGEYELTTAVEQLLASGKPILLYAIQGPWRDIGRPADLEEAQSLI